MSISVTVMKRAGRKAWECQWVDLVTGRKRTKSTGETTRKAAERFAGKLADDIENGKLRQKNRTTWQEVCDRYALDVVPSLARKTADKIAGAFSLVRKTINPNLAKSLDSSEISRFQRLLRERGLSEAYIKSTLCHLKAVVRWAHSQGMIDAVPKINMPKRANTMKGRPITTEEFERMLAKCDTPAGDAAAESWRFLLRGLWWSGLRLGEALNLHWTDDRLIAVAEVDGEFMLRIRPEGQKSGKDTITPIAPEFDEFLRAVPEAKRRGFVFGPLGKKGEPLRRVDVVSCLVADIGRAAGVKVSERPNRRKPDDGPTVKHASAHDLRRAFGERWAKLVMPAVLQELMRHENITTTLTFYAGRNAKAASAAARDALRKKGSGTAVANTSANSGFTAGSSGRHGATQTTSDSTFAE